MGQTISIRERMKDSPAFNEALRRRNTPERVQSLLDRSREAMAEAADAIVEGQRQEDDRQLSAVLSAFVEEAKALRAAMEQQTVGVTEALRLTREVASSVATRLTAIDTVAQEWRTNLEAFEKAIEKALAKPAARSDDRAMIAALNEVGRKIDAVRDAVLAPVELETDMMGEPVRAVREKSR